MKSILLFHFFVLSQFLSAQTFTETTPSPFTDVLASSVAFSDVDGDGDWDALITGINDFGYSFAKLYSNDGLGNFTEVTGTPFYSVSHGSIAFADVDGDGDQDLLITGNNLTTSSRSRLYINDGLGSFTETIETPFASVRSSSIAFGDMDGDGDLDVIITGYSGSSPVSKLYFNNGSGTFTESIHSPFAGVERGSVALGDVDGDGDLDVLLTGTSFNWTSKLYTNDGEGRFTEAIGHPFHNVQNSSGAFADVDGDGDLDVVITGLNNPLGFICKLYTNNGSGSFTEVIETPFAGVQGGSIAFADVDGDGDQDVLITGQHHSLGLIYNVSKLYINDGSGNYTEVTDHPFVGVNHCSVAFADLDGDGDQDLLITGQDNSFRSTSKLYMNDGITSTDESVSGLSIEFTSFPNPVTTRYLNVNYDSVESGFVSLIVYDSNGRLLSQQKEFATIGQQAFSIEIPSLSSGWYFIELNDGKRRGSAKFMVQ